MELIDTKLNKLRFLCDEQNREMWKRGLLTVHDGEWIYYIRMDGNEPVHTMKDAPRKEIYEDSISKLHTPS